MAVPTPALELAQAMVTSFGGGSAFVDAHSLPSFGATLTEVTTILGDTKFTAELSAMEQWYRALSKPGRTASVYTLLQHADESQLRFYISVLHRMLHPEVPEPEAGTEAEGTRKSNLRPPSLVLPIPTNSHSIHDSVEQNGKNTDNCRGTLTGLPGLDTISPHHLNMIANAGLSPEAQILAVQVIMSSVMQPNGAQTVSQRPLHASGKKPSQTLDAKNWRAPASAKYPTSALRTGGLRTTVAVKNTGSKSAGLQGTGIPSAGLQTPDSGASTSTPREEDFNPELLNNISGWLRSLRLHKYTGCFEGLTWQEMVVLDDATLEAKGVAALGARRRLLRAFEQARKKVGMGSTDGAPPTPYSAVSTSKLSAHSPVFVPSSERAIATLSFARPPPDATNC